MTLSVDIFGFWPYEMRQRRLRQKICLRKMLRQTFYDVLFLVNDLILKFKENANNIRSSLNEKTLIKHYKKWHCFSVILRNSWDVIVT